MGPVPVVAAQALYDVPATLRELQDVLDQAEAAVLAVDTPTMARLSQRLDGLRSGMEKNLPQLQAAVDFDAVLWRKQLARLRHYQQRCLRLIEPLRRSLTPPSLSLPRYAADGDARPEGLRSSIESYG